ncbi:phenylacetate--CoA ligase PaaK [Aromatoleum aromaticum]|uniref:Phenylacetate-coenzyme A ligase n=1 Tax=Aromatoleum aromaticum (strain DSM 19018 / LMG 30748 / EbN1) TaxID=76114 RepID=Q5P0H2_AROAE|nr:phenylacetate--CoA ligase PaaK [Aromatoleum aromaticum]NMG53855.1 phenylacetate--CoA ligase [Aromatoleum aromaticum]CAI09192.1 Anaerobic phenylacetate CoA ligase [Aromatoleum aromaticum EbN1]
MAARQDWESGRASAGDELEPIETASREELAALQLERMKWSLQHAYDNVPHYRAAFDAAGVHPSDLKQLSDLARFPFTSKKELRENYPYGMFAVPMSEIVRVHASSGTTGLPTVVGYTKNDIEMWAGVVGRSLRAAGGTRNDIILNSYGYGLFTGGLGAHYGGENLGAAVIPMGGGNTEKQVQLIREFAPTIILATPSYMLTIADELQRQGIDPTSTSLRLGVFGAEPWTNEMRREIETRLGIDAIDIYGLSEVIGPGVACECIETKDGPHIWEDHFYPEIIDPETGEVLPDGQLGELVFTSLTKEALPIIRYRTRDLTMLLPGTARPMRRMGKITGRSDDMLIIRGVNVFPTQIEEILLKHECLCGHYQLQITREHHMDEMTVLAEVRHDLSEVLSASQRAAIATELRHEIKSAVGVSADVHVLETDSIERTQVGKAKRVVDKRPKASV